MNTQVMPGHVWQRRWLKLIAAGAIAAAAIGPASADLGTLIENVQSDYNDIYIHENADGYRTMVFGYQTYGYTESVYNINDPTELPVRYTRRIMAALAYPLQVNDAMFIGLGGGRTSWYIHHYMPEVNIQAVELDPEVYKFAQEYFGIVEDENYRVDVRDGRIHAMLNDATYDLVVVDAYRGPFVPFHLMTVEFYELLKTRLNEGGVVAQNIEPSTMLFQAAAATLQEVFDNVDFYPAGGNVVAIAYDGPAHSDEDLKARGAAITAEFGLRYPIEDLVDGKVAYELSEDAEYLTDDFAPVNTLMMIEAHNEPLAE